MRQAAKKNLGCRNERNEAGRMAEKTMELKAAFWKDVRQELKTFGDKNKRVEANRGGNQRPRSSVALRKEK